MGATAAHVLKRFAAVMGEKRQCELCGNRVDNLFPWKPSANATHWICAECLADMSPSLP